MLSIIIGFDFLSSDESNSTSFKKHTIRTQQQLHNVSICYTDPFVDLNIWRLNTLPPPQSANTACVERWTFPSFWVDNTHKYHTEMKYIRTTRKYYSQMSYTDTTHNYHTQIYINTIHKYHTWIPCTNVIHKYQTQIPCTNLYNYRTLCNK